MFAAAARRLTAIGSHVSSAGFLNRSPQLVQLNLSRPTVSIPNSVKLGSSLSTSTVDMSSVKELVDKAIKEDKVLVFSKTYCPYCRRAKNILQQATDNVKVYELDERDDGSEIQAYLKQLNGQSTVPHVYINGEFIGGCSDLQAIPAAELKRKITA